jgi:hypothetical protein
MYHSVICFLVLPTGTTEAFFKDISSSLYLTEISYTYTIDATTYNGDTDLSLTVFAFDKKQFKIRYLKSDYTVTIIEEYIPRELFILALANLPFLYVLLFFLLGAIKRLPFKLQIKYNNIMARK